MEKTLNYTDKYPLYQAIVADERHYYSASHSVIAVYSGVITATIAGIGYLVMNLVASALLGLILLIGGAFLFFVGRTANLSSRRSFRKLLETSAFRANIEYELGLADRAWRFYTGPRETSHMDETWNWQGGLVVPDIQLQYRAKFNSAKEFVEKSFKNRKRDLGDRWSPSYHRWAMVLFCFVMGVGLFVVLAGISVFVNHLDEVPKLFGF